LKRKRDIATAERKPAVPEAPMPASGQPEPTSSVAAEPPAAVTRYDGQGGKRGWFHLVLLVAALFVANMSAYLLVDAFEDLIDRSDGDL
jgi:hypothetical protein